MISNFCFFLLPSKDNTETDPLLREALAKNRGLQRKAKAKKKATRAAAVKRKDA